MISETIQQRLNKQVNDEFYSGYAYLAMSAYCKSISLNGFAHWMYVQYQEEFDHAMKIYEYILDQDGHVTLLPIEQPQTEFKSVAEVFEKALAHEQHITSLLNDLTSLTLKENDHATNVFLHWFITEQIEEEAAVRDILESLKLVGDSGEGLLILDREVAQRASSEMNK